MKNLFYFYSAVFAPAILIFTIKNAELIGGNAFLISILSYALIYRPFLDGNRLYQKGLIKKNEIWKIYIPFNSIKFKNFKELYLKK